MRKIINILEKKLPWGIIGGLLGIIGLIVGIYYAIYYEKKTEVSFQIVNESDILDVRKPLKDLDIFFENKDIQKANLNLKVIRLKIINTGQVDILQNFYDKNEDWGFKISSGKIIEIRPTKTNSNYLEDNINPVVDGDLVKLEKTILEKEKYVSFEILVLHNKNSPPSIIPVGKIAGINDFVITDSNSNNEETSFWNDLFYGKLHTHLIRFILYFSLFILGAITSIATLAFISSKKEKLGRNKRKKKLERMALPSSIDDPSLDLIYNAYIDGNFDLLKKLNSVLKSNIEIQNRIEKVKITKKYTHDLKQLESSDTLDNTMNEDDLAYTNYWIQQEHLLRTTGQFDYVRGIEKVDKVLYKLLENKKIIIEDKRVIVDIEFKNALNVIIAVIS
ncbi:hypothetical protein H7F28_13850 [Brevibacterium sp. PAMC23299]|nr:hypothetical protein H7F28_13850 [Brevibacterium sp. PAMC23299]